MLDTESRHSTGLDQGPSRDPWLTMDYYLGTDSLSLQEMLDVDIKCEMEGFIGGHPELGFNFTDLSPLELDDDPVGCQNDLNGWFGGATSLLNGNSNSSTSNFNLDLSGGDAASVMVNPNSVMPHMSVRSPSPSSRRHFAFSPTNDIKEEKVDVEDDMDNELLELENDLENENDNDNENENDNDDTETEQYENDITETEDDDEDEEDEEEEEEMKPAAPSIKAKSLILPTSTIKTMSPQIGKSHSAPKMSIGSIRVQNYKVIQSPSQAPHVRKQIYNNNVHVSSNSAAVQTKRDKDFDLSDYEDKPYPKPAYSYSCLIAMALKNSQTGSLPVSEIYNFMCEHFPYFKTAPNGWKNSVRHNLSLNKCFEKIEKPAGNGNQRKGCLWAINPEKIAKMDEEVQKWSRKDPLAIKKAMVYPDQLELLERGEMKYASNGDLSAEESESSGDETAEESSPAYDEQPSVGHSHSHNHSHSHHIAANSVTDSYDESSQDCDIDITEHLYDEIEIEENKEALHMQLNITKQESASFGYELSPSSKRQKTAIGGTTTTTTTTTPLQGNYVYQSVSSSRRKTPLLLRPGPNAGWNTQSHENDDRVVFVAD
ncbi:forkhead box protein P2 [Belonocnema kinseyi]|uniref:forkhead box protein P2 n=1 Tax=Belonocnema kinseyi TaxID=2817044 RepID=UPI00143DBEB2|nr:forkhead box protein P2 [Belonocnema kinseyi]